MTKADVVLVLALVAFAVVWWLRRIPERDGKLMLLAIVALCAALYGLFDDRWQAGVGLVVSGIFLLTLLVRKLRGAPPSDKVPYVSGLLFSLLAALGIAAIQMFPVWDLPAPSGSHPVGVRTFELVDSSRPGLFGTDRNSPRRLLVRVWYPAARTEGFERRPYFDAAEARHTARSIGQLFGFPALAAYQKHVRTNSYEDAPLLVGAKGLPTIFYSHGYTSFLGQNTVLMEELASHGYVVYSIQHTSDSAATVFPDGAVVPMDPALAQPMQPPAGGWADLVKGFLGKTFDDRLDGQLRVAEQGLAHNDRYAVRSAPIWLADRIFVHDRLQQGAVPASVVTIAAASDFTRTGEAGMSFGGSTTGAVCMVDARCAAGVNMDGRDMDYAPLDADVPRPFLVFHSDFGLLTRHIGGVATHSVDDFSYEKFATAGTRADLYRLQLQHTTHLGLSDFTLFMRRPLRDPLWGDAPTRVIIGSQNDFIRGFFDKYLRGMNNDFPRAEYRKYQDWVIPYDNSGLRTWWLAKPEAERAAIEARIEKIKATAKSR